LGARADRFGVTVAFRSDLASFAALERALTAAACPWFGVDLDPVAILRDGWSMDEIFARLGGLIRHVRGRDAVIGADRRTRAASVGQGSTNWPELLTALDSAGYRGWTTVDPLELADRTGSAIAGAKHLRDLIR
jgi:sugar phosphate isomerase/epimerase